MNKQEILDNVQEYYDWFEKVHQNNYRKSILVLKELVDAHSIALAVFHKIILSKSLQPGYTSKKINDILLQIAIFYQGIVTCEQTIRNAQYNLAAALVRQEYEIIGNINEIKQGTQKPGKGPNVKSGLSNFGRQYSILSELTHAVGDEWHYVYEKYGDLYSEDLKPVTLMPVQDEKQCLNLYKKHVLFVLVIIEKLLDLYQEMYGENLLTEDLNMNLNSAKEILKKYGIDTDNSSEDIRQL